MIKQPPLQEDKTNMQVFNNRTSNYMRQKLMELQEEIDGLLLQLKILTPIPLSVIDILQTEN